MKKVNLFIDMDGVLAVYHKNTSKHMYTKGFFLNRPVIKHMMNLSKLLIGTNDYEVYILSSVINSPYCVPEKNMWLEKYIPEIKQENRIFVPYGQVKAEFVATKVNLENSVNVILDDYTNNLVKWKVPGALPIKVLNGINNTNGTWHNLEGEIIAVDDDLYKNFNYIQELIKKGRSEV